MAATGYTPISLYYSTTASAAPTAGNLVNGELAINITDGKLYYKDNTGTVKVIAGAGGAGVAGGSNTQVQFNSSGSLAGSSNFTWNGTTLAITGAVTATADSAFTSTGALQLPSGTTGQQPTGVAGKIRFNTTTGTFEGYNGTTWGAIGGAPTGAYTRTDVTATGGQTTFTGLTYQVGYIQVYLNGVLLDPSDYTATSGTSVVLGTAAVAGDIVSFVVLTISSIGNAANISGGAANQIPYQSGVSTTTFSSGLTFDGTNFATTGTASATKLIPTGGSATGNGMYLPASNTLAWSNNGSETMRLDSSGNLGLGVTPNTWYLNTSVYKALQFGSSSLFFGNTTASSSNLDLIANAYLDTSAVWRYLYSSNASKYGQSSGAHAWYTAPSGTAGNAITFTQAMTLDASGNLMVGGTGYTAAKITSVQQSDTAGTLSFGLGAGGGTAQGLRLTTGNALAFDRYNGGWYESMRIDSSGNVGIGTTSPTGNLSIDNSDLPYQTFKRAGTVKTYFGVGNGTSLSGSAVAGDTVLRAEQSLVFRTSGDTYGMKLSSAGGFSVGTTADPGAGAIYATGNITAYYSDDRLKTKLGGIENALDKVKSLSGFYYEANQTAQDLGYKVKREVGVSAQQVQAVLPEVVSPAPIDQQYLTVDYERIVPLLIEAIKELEAKVAKLEAK